MAKIARSTRYVLLAAAMIGAAAVLLVRQWERPLPVGDVSDPAEPSSQPKPTANIVAPKDKSVADAPLWAAVDKSGTGTLPEYPAEWSTEGRVLVRVSAAIGAAAGWRVGDQLTLPIPQLGTVYRPLIESIDDGPGPSRAALGEMTGKDGQRRRFVVTVGPAHVFAYIDTIQGSFELVGDDDLGWLLPTSSMMAGFDYSEPDYFLPEGWDEPEIR